MYVDPHEKQCRRKSGFIIFTITGAEKKTHETSVETGIPKPPTVHQTEMILQDTPKVVLNGDGIILDTPQFGHPKAQGPDTLRGISEAPDSRTGRHRTARFESLLPAFPGRKSMKCDEM